MLRRLKLPAFCHSGSDRWFVGAIATLTCTAPVIGVSTKRSAAAHLCRLLALYLAHLLYVGVPPLVTQGVLCSWLVGANSTYYFRPWEFWIGMEAWRLCQVPTLQIKCCTDTVHPMRDTSLDLTSGLFILSLDLTMTSSFTPRQGTVSAEPSHDTGWIQYLNLNLSTPTSSFTFSATSTFNFSVQLNFYLNLYLNLYLILNLNGHLNFHALT